MLIGGSDYSYKQLKQMQKSGINLTRANGNRKELKRLGFDPEHGDSPSLVLRFKEGVKTGDIVIMKRGVKSIIAIGTVENARERTFENKDIECSKDGYFFTDLFHDMDKFCLKHGRCVQWYIPEPEDPT